MARTRKPVTSEDAFSRALKDRRQISISVIGRRSGRTIKLPVWFVLAEDALWLLPVYGSQTQWYRNLLMSPAITIKAGGEQLTLQARALKMSLLKSKLNPRAAEFRANAQRMQDLVVDLKDKIQTVSTGGDASAVRREDPSRGQEGSARQEAGRVMCRSGLG